MSLQVTPQTVSDAANSCRQSADTISGELGSLQSFVQSMEDEWRGIASTDFQTMMQEYHTFATMLNQTLEDIASGLNGNFVNYTDTEQQNITNIQRLNDTLPSNLQVSPN